MDMSKKVLNYPSCIGESLLLWKVVYGYKTMATADDYPLYTVRPHFIVAILTLFSYSAYPRSNRFELHLKELFNSYCVSITRLTV
jgi:hypothetical protein